MPTARGLCYALPMACKRKPELVELPGGRMAARGRCQPEHEPLQAPAIAQVSDTVSDLLAELIELCPEGWSVSGASIKRDRASTRPASERSRYFAQVYFAREPTPAQPTPARSGHKDTPA